ncbi:MAG: Gfo/Idh/MocA family protein [Flexilinea sp.]
MSIKKIAVIGTGFIGLAHIDALRRIKNVEISALCDTVGAREKAEAFNIPNFFLDYKEMMDSIPLDAVHISTPNHTHFPIAMYAIEHGISVICEKPFTTSVEQAEKLVESAKKAGVSAAVNLHNRFYPMANEAKRLVDRGETGDIISITGGYLQDWLQYETDFNWRLLSKNTGPTRIVSDIGSHWIDLAQFISGLKIVEVMAEFNCVYPERISTDKDGKQERIAVDTEDMAAMLFRFENGALGDCFVSSMQAGRKNKTFLTVAGKKCALTWDSEDSNNLEIGFRSEPNRIITKDPSLLDPGTAPLSCYPGGHVEGFPDAFKNHFQHFYDSIDDKSIIPEYASFADGLYEMKILEAIFESSKTRRWVKVK